MLLCCTHFITGWIKMFFILLVWWSAVRILCRNLSDKMLHSDMCCRILLLNYVIIKFDSLLTSWKQLYKIDDLKSLQESILIVVLIRLLLPIHPQGRLLFMRGCLLAFEDNRFDAKMLECLCAIDTHSNKIFYYSKKLYFATRVYLVRQFM